MKAVKAGIGSKTRQCELGHIDRGWGGWLSSADLLLKDPLREKTGDMFPGPL